MMDINMTPLIDVLLVLLVMFIITIPVMTHAVKLDMPRPDPNQLEPPIRRSSSISRSCSTARSPGTGNEIPSVEALEGYFRREAQMDPQPELHIRPNKRANYDVVARVLAAAQRNKLTKIGLIGAKSSCNGPGRPAPTRIAMRKRVSYWVRRSAEARGGNDRVLHCCLRLRSHSRRSARPSASPSRTRRTAIGRKQWDTAQQGDPGGAGRTASHGVRRLQDQRAAVWYVYLQQGRNADAAKLLEQQIASGQMPAGERTQRTKTLAQLYFRAGNYAKAIQVANDYLKAVPGDREMQMMVAQGYYQQKNYKAAICGRREAEPAAGSRARTCCSSCCAATTSLATRQAPPRRSSSC